MRSHPGRRPPSLARAGAPARSLPGRECADASAPEGKASWRAKVSHGREASSLKALVVTIVLALAASSAAAQTKLFTPVTDFTDLRHEPDVHEGGSYLYPQTDSPASGYPADPGNFAAAKLGGDPVKIVEMRPDVACYADPVHDCNPNWLLGEILDRGDFVTPWTQWRALYGTWTDLNEDGYIQNDKWDDADPAKNAAGLRLDSTREYAGETEDEWVGYDSESFPSGVNLVSYFEPGLKNGKPDILFRAGYIDGYFVSLIYITPFTNIYEQALLETMVTETFIGKISTDSPDREFVKVDGEPHDTDVYTSIDGTVESLYIEAVHTYLGVNGVQIGVQRNASGLTAGSEQGVGHLVLPAVGPTFAKFFPASTDEIEDNGGKAYADGWHPWMDIQPRYGVFYPQPQLIASAAINAWPTPRGDGKDAVMPGELYPVTRYGLWFDEDGDGWIGNASGGAWIASSGRPVFNNPECGKTSCGMRSDPQDFTSVDSKKEWRSLCDTTGVTVLITPLTEGSVWPDGGVYVMGDDPSDGRDDNSLDDMYRDFNDLSVDRLVTEGTILATSTCNANNSPYQYFSDVILLLPTGNARFAIELKGVEKCANMTVVGIDLVECTTERDVVAPWAFDV